MKLLFLLAASLAAQPIAVVPAPVMAPIVVNPGSKSCTGAVYQDQTLGTMQFGVVMTCDIAVPTGLYQVAVQMADPRSATTSGGVGLRLFTITANGQQTMPIDLYKSPGPRTITTQYLYAMAGAGALHLTWVATAGNAVWNSITVTALQVTAASPVTSSTGTAIGQIFLAAWPAVPVPAPTTTANSPLQ